MGVAEHWWVLLDTSRHWAKGPWAQAATGHWQILTIGGHQQAPPGAGLQWAVSTPGTTKHWAASPLGNGHPYQASLGTSKQQAPPDASRHQHALGTTSSSHPCQELGTGDCWHWAADTGGHWVPVGTIRQYQAAGSKHHQVVGSGHHQALGISTRHYWAVETTR